MEQSFVTVLTTMGFPGVVIGALAYWCVRLHIELREERAGRLTDVKELSLAARQGTTEIHKTASVMGEVLVEMREQRQREHDRSGRR